MRDRALILMLAAFLLINGCAAPEKPVPPVEVCDKPYMQVGADCCLDENGNSICDSDEAAPAENATLPQPEAPPANATLPPIANITAPGEPSMPATNATANATAPVECAPPLILREGACCVDEDYNGICDLSEGAITTPNMSISVSLPPVVCGDGYCYLSENWSNCARDCGCPAGYVLQAGACAKFVYVPGTSYRTMEVCGNGVCKAGTENQTTCCKDCGCPAGKICKDNVCSTITLYTPPLVAMASSPDSYIIAYIYGMKVHDDTDPFGAGELMLLTYAGSGERAQKVNWPYRIWHSVDSGSTIEQAVPLFALKEGEMGNALALSMTAIDNDQLPSWLEFFLDIVDFVTKPLQALLVLATTVPASIASGSLDTSFGTSMLNSMEGALRGNELIGSVNRVYGKSADWGVKSEPYSERAGGLTANYEIKRVSVPKSSKLGVRVHNITFSDTGDYFNGEVKVYIRAATGFGEQDMSGVAYKYPASGAWSLGDNAFIHSGACTPDGSGSCPENPLFTYEANGPFIFLEISAWDEDNPEAGDDHDSIGQASWVIPYDAFDTPPLTRAETYSRHIAYPWKTEGSTITIPYSSRGNMKAYFEFYRIEN